MPGARGFLGRAGRLTGIVMAVTVLKRFTKGVWREGAARGERAQGTTSEGFLRSFGVLDGIPCTSS